jgi:predicted membrane channel-forming protein YqfA (hemolysin III family)
MKLDFREAQGIWFGTCTVFGIVCYILDKAFKDVEWTPLFLLLGWVLVLVYYAIVVRYEKIPSRFRPIDKAEAHYPFIALLALIGVFVYCDYALQLKILYYFEQNQKQEHRAIHWNAFLHIIVYLPILSLIFLRLYSYKLRYKSMYGKEEQT